MPENTVKPYLPTVIVSSEKGKSDIHLVVPNDQIWLYAMMERQEKVLNGIKTACTIIAVLIILTVVMAACSALKII
ncbi:MAG: hypothetical protein ABSG01_09135 [Anaerolineales bacterium]|jgi:hypothetical protein